MRVVAGGPILSRRVALALCTPSLFGWPAPAVWASKPYLESRFVVDIPDGFVVSKRKATTGTIFVAGNFPRASVVSITAWPLIPLLREDARSRDLPGFPAEPALRVPDGPITLDALGSAKDVSQLLLRARDRDASSGALQSVLSHAKLDGDRLQFLYTTESPVADPDALEKERGTRQLIRVTTGTSMLGTVPSADGTPESAIFTIFASALQQDWDKVRDCCR